MPAQKILTLLRHAKAENGAPAQDDHERALTRRGIEAAAAVGKFLAEHRVHPQRVLCSDAVRARQTLEHVFPFLSPSPLQGEGRDEGSIRIAVDPRPNPLPEREREFVTYTSKLYLASMNEILSLVAHTPESVRRLMIVGHNPGLHELGLKLARDMAEEAREELAVKFPTCAFVSIALDTPWSAVAQAKGRLEAFVTPKELAAMGDE